MPKLRNISPLGDLDVPLLRTVIPAGETVDVTEDQARALLQQPGNYEPADKSAKALAGDLAAQNDLGQADPRTGPEQPAQAAVNGAATEGE